jgi:hypothetical protein
MVRLPVTPAQTQLQIQVLAAVAVEMTQMVVTVAQA